MAGVVFGGMLTYILMKQFETSSSKDSSHVIAYEIKRLNKMIVAEQAVSDVYSHKNSFFVPGLEGFFSFDKKVMLLVNAKVQATYDLSQMKIEVDSVRKEIIINQVPELEIQTFPDVQFYDLDQSMFNSFGKDELNRVKEKAVAEVLKSVDEKKLRTEAHEQLIENLTELYLLSKAYDWKVVDKTGEFESIFNY